MMINPNKFSNKFRITMPFLLWLFIFINTPVFAEEDAEEAQGIPEMTAQQRSEMGPVKSR